MSALAAPVREMPQATETLTAHAWLIPLGLFAERIGLIAGFETVPIGQKTVKHSPQTKLLQFLVAHLAGCKHMKDMSRGAHPLDQDQALAEAWQQPAWADYSGVSRTLWACDKTTLDAVDTVISDVSAPFIQQEVSLALSQTGYLVYDFDLTGRPVSASSRTYPNAAFGYMHDGVHFGYQAAMASMHSPTYGRLWLDVKQHPGNTVSAPMTRAFVDAAERTTGVRPRRRTELVRERLQTAEQKLDELNIELARAEQRVLEVTNELAWQREVFDNMTFAFERIKTKYREQQRPETPHGRLNRLRQRNRAQKRRVERYERELAKALRIRSRIDRRYKEYADTVTQVFQWLDQLEADNETNPQPVAVHLRIDAGFATGDTLTMLIELGYDVYTRARHPAVTKMVRSWVTDELTWTAVGSNIDMLAWPDKNVTNCAYPLDVGLTRVQNDDDVSYGVLLHYGATPVTDDVPAWSETYNGRQSIEAGIKEGKHIFQIGHLKVRAPIGLQIQERFAALAANLIRWAANWLQTIVPELPPELAADPVCVKHWVEVAMHTTAWVRREQDDWCLRFTKISLYADLEFWLRARQLVVQWTLPFCAPVIMSNSVSFAPT